MSASSNRRRLGFRFEKDWTREEIAESARNYASIVTVPVNAFLDYEHRVYDFGAVEKLLKDAELIAVEDCSCRLKKHNCDSPLDVCFDLDDYAEIKLKDRSVNARRVTFDEAMQALRRAHEAGLVLMALTRRGDDKPKHICNCCSCCCFTLSGLVRFGFAPLVLTSKMVTVDQNDLCQNCGICVERCQLGARRMEGLKMVYDSSKCLGCGLCVSTCPAKAIKLVERKNKFLKNKLIFAIKP